MTPAFETFDGEAEADVEEVRVEEDAKVFEVVLGVNDKDVIMELEVELEAAVDRNADEAMKYVPVLLEPAVIDAVNGPSDTMLTTVDAGVGGNRGAPFTKRTAP